MPVTILAIESSCDDTSVAIIRDGYVLSNLIANQDVHMSYGGVVPELASRAHQANIVPVTHQALLKAGLEANDVNAVAFTRGPGLLGSLLVGTSFAKGFALAQNVPLIEVNHLQAHVLAHFILEKDKENRVPSFPFLCLLVSGGHTRIIIMRSQLEMEVIGNTIDDAAGEAFDKCGKVMGFTYPAGPIIDKLAKEGNIHAFKFAKPRIKGLDFSFSGLKTSFLYFLRDRFGFVCFSSVHNYQYPGWKDGKCFSADRNLRDWYCRRSIRKFWSEGGDEEGSRKEKMEPVYS
jgi:N6-L-threonylcarbamoyladenine synthase